MTLRGSSRRLPVIVLLLLLSSSPALSFDTPSGRSFDLRPRDATLANGDQLVSTHQATSGKRPDVGTKDAPVDGLDGKPHAGPFVNPVKSPSDAGRDQAQTGYGGDKPVAEDGVMNDPNRTPPRKGTTGTEGGMSQKERDRIAQGAEAPFRMPRRPDPPKDTASNSLSGKKSDTDYPSSKDSVKLDKSADRSDDAHKDVTSRLKEYGYASHQYPGFKTDSSDDDDDDDDDHEEEGIHDIIPWDSLAGSFSSIAATEIGDKTFIVAALMAMRHSRIQVFSAAFSALFIMTILSGLVGHGLGAIISKRWSALVAALLFLAFGAKSLHEGFAMSPEQGVNDEIREVQAELEEKEDMARHANGHRRHSSISPYALEAGRAANGRKSRSRSRLAAPRRSPSSSSSRSRSRPRPNFQNAMLGMKNLLSLLLSPAWVETFSMTFVGELGDRSQIATVAMAAGQEYFWVMVGASLGHFVCTGVAVIGGSVLAGRVSLRKVTLVGGAIFIGFGFFTLIEAARYWF